MDKGILEAVTEDQINQIESLKYFSQYEPMFAKPPVKLEPDEATIKALKAALGQPATDQ